MVMDMKELQQTLETAKAQMETSVKALVKEGTDAANAKVTALETQLASVNKSLDEVQKSIAAQAKTHVPGLDGTEAQKWSWQGFVAGALNQCARVGANAKDAFEKAGAGLEFEMLAATMQKRDAIAGDGSQGGYLIPEEQSNELVGLTIAKMPILGLGVTQLTGLYGDLPIPKITSRNTGYWVGETQAPTESTGAFGEFTLRPKKAGAFTKYSRRLVYQTRGTVESIIRQNITDALALKIHEGYLIGKGVDSEPKGIFNQSGMTTTAAIGAPGGRFTIDKAAEMLQNLDAANELEDGANMGILMRPEVMGGLKRERVRQYSGQPLAQAAPLNPFAVLMSQDELEKIIGVKLRTTTQILGTNVKISPTLSNVICGNWKQFYAGFWRGLEIRVSDVASDTSGNSAMLNDQFYMVAFQEVDCNVGRPTAFTLIEDAQVDSAQW